ncbi:hypothetical protein ACRAWF_19935 [Streptomyces sp. L7]
MKAIRCASINEVLNKRNLGTLAQDYNGTCWARRHLAHALRQRAPARLRLSSATSPTSTR